MNSAQGALGHGLAENTISRILQIFNDYPTIERVTLFGSRAKGNYRPGSDIDLCLDAPGLNLSTKLEIERRLDDLLLPWKIDLLLRQNIDNQALLEHIERVGIPLSN
jgi:predicted nucleotidyltransferase